MCHLQLAACQPPFTGRFLVTTGVLIIDEVINQPTDVRP
jgi:hypothetical protein